MIAAGGNSRATDWHAEGKAAGAECLAAALDYLARGWAAIPCCPPDHVSVGRQHGKHCKSPGKAPLVSWKQYQTELPTTDDLPGWWRQWPNANVWCAMGPVSGLVRLDVDAGQGEEFLTQISGGDVPVTLEMRTGAGRGLFYTIPPGFTPRITHQHGDKVHEGLSLLGQGAGTVMPPSRHKSGRRYAWIAGRGPDEITAAMMPGWLTQAMEPTTRRATRTTPSSGERVVEGGRNNRLASLAGAMRRVGVDFPTILAALSAENEERFDPPLDEVEVRTVAKSVSGYPPEPRVLATRANGTGKAHASTGETPKQTGVEIILTYLRQRYCPVFRVGNSIHATDGDTIPMIVACAVPTSKLIDLLETATDAPRYAPASGGGVKRDQLPPFFRKWASTAWGDLIDSLPDEDAADLGTDTATAETFRQLVRDALLSGVTLADVIDGTSVTQVERRSMIGWCLRFRRPGPWRSIRDYAIWCREREAEGGELVTTVAIRHELFAQLKADRRLVEMTATKWARRAARYGVGSSTEADRPHGRKAVTLDPGFLAELTAGCPTNDPTENCPHAEGEHHLQRGGQEP